MITSTAIVINVDHYFMQLSSCLHTHRAPLRYFYPSSAPRPLLLFFFFFSQPSFYLFTTLSSHQIQSSGTTHHGVAQSGPVSGSFRHGFTRVKVAYQYNNSSQCTRMTGVRFGSSVLNLMLSSVQSRWDSLYTCISLPCPAMRDHERTHRSRERGSRVSRQKTGRSEIILS